MIMTPEEFRLFLQIHKRFPDETEIVKVDANIKEQSDIISQAKENLMYLKKWS